MPVRPLPRLFNPTASLETDKGHKLTEEWAKRLVEDLTVKFISLQNEFDGGTTKTSPGTVDAWMKVDINGVTHYIPCYTSKTS
jgi:hypothetical protein